MIAMRVKVRDRWPVYRRPRRRADCLDAIDRLTKTVLDAERAANQARDLGDQLTAMRAEG